jgi:hypothetical protein
MLALTSGSSLTRVFASAAANQHGIAAVVNSSRFALGHSRAQTSSSCSCHFNLLHQFMARHALLFAADPF